MTELADTPAPLGQIVVTLSRSDFMYYNWVIALERPVLPFFAYTFVLLSMASLLGIWPAGRAFALAVMFPALGYVLWLWLSARGLWARYPDLAKKRTYSFKEQSYLVETAGKKLPLAYDKVGRVLEARPAFYLIREDGTADILPKRSLEDARAVKGFLKEKLSAPWKGSSFL